MSHKLKLSRDDAFDYIDDLMYKKERVNVKSYD